MANKKITDLTEKVTLVDGDWVEIVDSEDLTESPQGSSKKAQRGNVNANKADKSNVLELDNTTAYTPTLDNHPATKKYVDDNAGGGGTAYSQGLFSDNFNELVYLQNLTSTPTETSGSVLIDEDFSSNTQPSGMTIYTAGAGGAVNFVTELASVVTPTATTLWATSLRLRSQTLDDLDTASYQIDFRAKTNQIDAFFGFVLTKVDPSTLSSSYYFATSKGATDSMVAYLSSFSANEMRLIDYATTGTATAIAYDSTKQTVFRNYKITLTPTDITIIDLTDSITISRATTVARAGSWYPLLSAAYINQPTNGTIEFDSVKITKL